MTVLQLFCDAWFTENLSSRPVILKRLGTATW